MANKKNENIKKHENKFWEIWTKKYPELPLQREYKMFQNRQHRADFAHPPSMVVIEIQGGIWGGKSGHNSGTGLIRDYKKCCLAQSAGYAFFPLAEKMFDDAHLKLIADTIIKRMAQKALTK